MEDAGPFVRELIARMAGERDAPACYVGSETVSWRAHREAERLDGAEYGPVLRACISGESDARRLVAGFTLLGFLAANLRDPGLLEWALSRVEPASLEEVLHAIFAAVSDCGMPIAEHVDRVAFFVDDDREMVRHAAIRALRWDATRSAKTEAALVDVLEHFYDEYDVRYAANSLARVGTARALPHLTRVLSQLRDPEASAAVEAAIATIRGAVVAG